MNELIRLLIPASFYVITSFIFLLFKKGVPKNKLYNLTLASIFMVASYLLSTRLLNIDRYNILTNKYYIFIVGFFLIGIILLTMYTLLIKYFNKVNNKYKIVNIKNLNKFINDKINITSISIFSILSILYFLIIDLILRNVAITTGGFGKIFNINALLFTLSISIILTVIIVYIPKKIRKVVYIIQTIFWYIIFLTNFFLLNAASKAFSIFDLKNASEGLHFINYISKYITFKFLVVNLILIILMLWMYRLLKEFDNIKISIKSIIILIVIIILSILACVISYKLYPKYENGAWERVFMEKYYFDEFDDTTKALASCGILEYTFRDARLYIVRNNQKIGSKEEIKEYIKNNYKEYEENDYTGLFKGKNVIMIMMESIDNTVINYDTMPTLLYMMENGWNFTSRYNGLTSGGSTIQTEYTSLSGLFYDYTHVNNINNNKSNTYIPYLFSQNGYKTTSVHENKGIYYNRETLHKNLGFETSYFLLDRLSNVKAYSDAQIIENDDVYNVVVPKEADKFMTFIITMSPHGPYDKTNSSCIDITSNENECFSMLAQRTDDMLKQLLERLEESNTLENTVLILYADHSAYSYNYTNEDLEKFKLIEDTGRIKNIPFVIYSKDINPEEYDDLLNDIDIVPTILNLFGIEYNPNNYPGTDYFSSNHKNLITFSDNSWYDGTTYSLDGKNISNEEYKENTEYTNNIINFSKMILTNDYSE